MEINFKPQSDKSEFATASKRYSEIWEKEGSKIIEKIEEVSGLKFQENLIEAEVFEGVSHSNPLRLRASYKDDTKLSTMIHELGHRLLRENGIRVEAATREDKSLILHKILDLILYDIWIDLYGKEFAGEAVAAESSLRPFYNEAWDWSLSKTREERKRIFSEIMSTKLFSEGQQREL